MTVLPHYMYGSYESPRRGDGALFHYTSLKSFKAIMSDMTLLPSSFEKLNDMNEGNVHNMNLSHNFMVMSEAENYIKENCHILCFAQNYEMKIYPNYPTSLALVSSKNNTCFVRLK